MSLNKQAFENIFTYRATILKVVDGDTIDAFVDLGFGIFRKERFRLNRIDAYEKTLRSGVTEEQKLKGIEGLYFLKENVEVKNVTIKTYKDSTDKYGRYLADVFVDGVCINDLMVEKGCAVFCSTDLQIAVDGCTEEVKRTMKSVEENGSSHNQQSTQCAHCEKRGGEYLVCEDCLASLHAFEYGSP